MGIANLDYLDHYWDQGNAVLRCFLPGAELGELQAEGGEPQLCKYEQLHTKPGPFYSDDPWYAD